MPISLRERAAYRADEKQNHEFLSAEQRRQMINARLPPVREQPPSKSHNTDAPRRSRLGVRRFIKTQIHLLVFHVIHTLFSLYIKLRQTYHVVSYQISSVLYYHHATPQYIRRDAMALGKRPQHVSVILKAEENQRPKADLDRMVDQAAEVATWCACAEIPMVSIFDKNGILKKHMSRVYEATTQKFAFYFGGQHPGLSVTSPHREAYTSTRVDGRADRLQLHLISSQDGRDSMVDLTRTLAEMSQKGKLSPKDISMELIDAELSEGIMSEPDLLILFSPYVELEGYPPWQIRLTEIFCLQDNETFGYQVFLKALRRFSVAQMRKGK